MARGRKPKLGQNFLIDDSACHRIVDALGDLSARDVIEIGPGRGAITDLLARRCRRLIAVELDPVLADALRLRFQHQDNVEILECDVLEVNFAKIARETGLDVVGNLPYYITSDILLHLFRAAADSRLQRAVLMMQREVGERLIARPGVREYGLLSATTELYAEAEHLMTLPPSAFRPQPGVFSSVVRLEFGSRLAKLGVDAIAFSRFLRHAFAQKRKTLQNNLLVAGYPGDRVAKCWPPELPRGVRAEQVGIEIMADLYRALTTEEA